METRNSLSPSLQKLHDDGNDGSQYGQLFPGYRLLHDASPPFFGIEKKTSMVDAFRKMSACPIRSFYTHACFLLS